MVEEIICFLCNAKVSKEELETYGYCLTCRKKIEKLIKQLEGYND